MTPETFIVECSRRGITLTVTPTGNVKYRAPGSLPPKVLDTIREHKAEIIAALKAELRNGDTETASENAKREIAEVRKSPQDFPQSPSAESGVYVLPDGRKLYEDEAGLWGYVPPGANPGDYLDNFPDSMQAAARRFYTRDYSLWNRANEKL
ncbi:MAG: hypothetical protein H7Y38_17280 [Armatimonadetes bacterium]|nr:hypothetical protein [Armatimonadota bacterium]